MPYIDIYTAAPSQRKKRYTTAAGFEPAREFPNAFRVHLLNHSDKQSHILCPLKITKYILTNLNVWKMKRDGMGIVVINALSVLKMHPQYSIYTYLYTHTDALCTAWSIYVSVRVVDVYVDVYVCMCG